jgi:hypothetical protein
MLNLLLERDFSRRNILAFSLERDISRRNILAFSLWYLAHLHKNEIHILFRAYLLGMAIDLDIVKI